MNTDTLLAIAVILCYSLGVLGVFFGTLSVKPFLKWIARRATFAGFALHSVALLLQLSAHDFSGLPFSVYMQIMAWSLVFLYICAWIVLRLSFLGLTAAPLALLLYVLSLRFSGTRSLLPEHLSTLFFTLHVWSLYCSLGLLALAFGAGLLFVYMEGKLKKKRPMAGFTRDLPSLSACDKVNRVVVLSGFPLYTLGLMAGFVWAPTGAGIAGNPKVLLSLFIWFLYALLFYQRASLRMRGRKTAVMAIVIFCVSALSVGVDYAISHHSTRMLP